MICDGDDRVGQAMVLCSLARHQPSQLQCVVCQINSVFLVVISAFHECHRYRNSEMNK